MKQPISRGTSFHEVVNEPSDRENGLVSKSDKMHVAKVHKRYDSSHNSYAVLERHKKEKKNVSFNFLRVFVSYFICYFLSLFRVALYSCAH